MAAGLLSVGDALAAIQNCISRPSGTADVGLDDALGRVLAENAVSDVDSPPHDKAMMDGFAVRSADTSAVRKVVEVVAAGAVPRVVVGPDQATRIMTGAPAPQGADAVLPVEQTQMEGPEKVRLLAPEVRAGANVMRRGEAFRTGQTIVPVGALIRSAEIAALAEIGRSSVSVVPAPTVSVLSTGDELVPASRRPEAGQIRNSNGPMLLAAAREAGCLASDLGVARDDPQELAERLRKGLTANVLLLSGGVSAGDRDFVPAVLAELGVERVFHKVAVKPGKPLWFGLRASGASAPTLVFGLPGNPVSSFVCFQLFVRPALAMLSGRGFTGLQKLRVRLCEAISNRGGRESYLPALLQFGEEGLPTAQLRAWRGSADLAGLVGADALLRLPQTPGELAAGDEVTALLLPSAAPRR